MNIRRVGERHKIVRLTDSGFGVDARVGLGGPSSYEALLIRSLQHDLVMGGISRAGSWHLPDPGIEPGSPPLHMDSLSTELPGKLNLTKN